MNFDTPIPKLKLSYGQVLYALCRGQPPTREAQDRLRYLRHLGIPYDAAEKGAGQGNRRTYGYEDLIELGVAWFALLRRMPPRDVAHYLRSERPYLRRLYRQAFAEQAPDAYQADWVKSRGRSVMMMENELFLRLHDRARDTPGQIEMVRLDELSGGDLALGDMVERYSQEAPRVLVPLTRLSLELVAWALEAPPTRAGRPG